MFSIRSKLFVAIFVSLILVIVSLAVMIHLDVKRGFINYLSEQEKQVLSHLAHPLIDQYEQTGSWQGLQADNGVWKATLVDAITPLFVSSDTSHDKVSVSNGRRVEYLAGRVFLLDASASLVAGNLKASPPDDLLPLRSHHQVVGYLGMTHRHRLTEKVEQEFIGQLQHRLGWIVLLMLLIAVSLSLWLSRHFGQPIHALRQASQRLTLGDYTTRIDTAGGDELAQLSQDVNILAERLEQHEAARKQWVADIAHELRTPLTILRGEVEALQDGINLPTATSFASLHQEVSQLQRLVDDLYQLAMSDSGALTYIMQPVDLLAVLQDSLSGYASRFKAAPLLVAVAPTTSVPMMVLGDAQRLQQLFHNLFENTLRYTDAPGQLSISAELKDDKLLIILEDSSPSVPTEALPRLFERLYRVESSRNRATGGTGLGLSICYNIVSAHHGSIYATQSSLGGVAIHIQLPVMRG